MLEFGDTLKKAREAKGYTISQLAETTHILPQIIENLEREDFSKIVAPIYGRGFVKLYCEAVGLEIKPMVDEFMDIYSGNRPPVIRMKANETTTPTPVEAPQVDITHVAAEPPVAVEPPVAAEPPMVAPTPIADPPLHTRDYRPTSYYMPDVPRRFWRLGLLVVGAIIIIALVVLAGRTLYRASMGIGNETPQKSENSAQTSLPRKPAKVPPLYID